MAPAARPAVVLITSRLVNFIASSAWLVFF
jgi:hypothetical protein